MSFDVLVKEAQTLSYEEQINLLAVLANSIKNYSSPKEEQNIIQQKLNALKGLSNLFSKEEIQAIDESIKSGISIKEVNL